MSMFDGIVGGLVGGALAKVAGNFIEQHGGVSGVMAKFQNHGMGDVVQSWIGSGPNNPISADHINQVFGSDAVAQLAAKFGMTPADLAQKLAQVLPQHVDQMTPGGAIPK